MAKRPLPELVELLRDEAKDWLAFCEGQPNGEHDSCDGCVLHGLLTEAAHALEVTARFAGFYAEEHGFDLAVHIEGQGDRE